MFSPLINFSDKKMNIIMVLLLEKLGEGKHGGTQISLILWYSSKIGSPVNLDLDYNTLNTHIYPSL